MSLWSKTMRCGVLAWLRLDRLRGVSYVAWVLWHRPEKIDDERDITCYTSHCGEYSVLSWPRDADPLYRVFYAYFGDTALASAFDTLRNAQACCDLHRRNRQG